MKSFREKKERFYISFLFDKGKHLCQTQNGIIFHGYVVNDFYCKSQ